MIPARRILLHLMSGGWIAVAAAQSSMPLTLDEPAWFVGVKAGVEWVRRVGRGRTDALMVATRDGRLLLVDATTGAARSADHLDLRPGFRAATPAIDHPASAQAAYLFDRHGVWAVRLSGSPGLIWQRGDGPAVAGFDNDPEVLTGWVEARVTAAGLLLLNRDGRLTLLSFDEGREHWRTDLGRLPNPVVHASGNTAVVLWRAGGATRAAFVAVTDTCRAPRVRALDDTWPIWSTLCGDGLLTLTPREAVWWPPQGAERRIPLPISPANAARAASWSPRDPLAADALLLLASGPRVAALRVPDGRPAWSYEADAGDDFTTLTISAGRAAATGVRGFAVLEAATGRPLLEHRRSAPVRLLKAHATENGVYTLYCRERPAPNTEDATACVQAELLRFDIPPAPDASRLVKPSATRGPAIPPGLLDTVWTDRCVVFVAFKGLLAWELP
mgnify:CR=1 FL=1